MKQKANQLSGKTWLQYSFSIWRDISKNEEERRLGHPAMFPTQLTDRLIEIYTRPGEIVLDPFLGSGTTIISAYRLGRKGIGVELSENYINLIKERIKNYQLKLIEPSQNNYFPKIFKDTIFHVSKLIKNDSVDLVITSPPYWNILNQARTADKKRVRNYSNSKDDFGNIESYDEFLESLKIGFSQIYKVLKKGAHCIIVVMDIRKKSSFYPFHMDLIKKMNELSFSLEDIIIWDRQKEYNNMRPLGYPYVFRVNKVHEYVLIFKK